jgi:hypothetical protein
MDKSKTRAWRQARANALRIGRGALSHRFFWLPAALRTEGQVRNPPSALRAQPANDLAKQIIF